MAFWRRERLPCEHHREVEVSAAAVAICNAIDKAIGGSAEASDFAVAQLFLGSRDGDEALNAENANRRLDHLEVVDIGIVNTHASLTFAKNHRWTPVVMDDRSEVNLETSGVPLKFESQCVMKGLVALIQFAKQS